MENECKGCIYDLTDKVEINMEIFETILDNCSACKRSKKEEFKKDFCDLYKGR